MTAKPIPHPYEDLMRHVHEHGVFKADRTGTGTRSVFGHQMRFDLRNGLCSPKAPRIWALGRSASSSRALCNALASRAWSHSL